MENKYDYYVPNDGTDTKIKPESIEQETTNQTYETGEGEPAKKKHGWGQKVAIVTAAAVIFGVVGGAAFQTTSFVAGKLLGTSSSSSSKSSDISSTKLTTTSSSNTSDVSEVASNVMPSIVSITNMSVQEVQSFFGGTQQQESESAGSGIIIGKNDSELLIVTNNHVVEGNDTLTVSFIDDESVEAQVKGTDATNDLAVVAVKLSDIKSDTSSKIKVATLGDSTKVNVGETAIAIGNALGYGQSVTVGVISAVDSQVVMENEPDKMLQTDAAINPGNSGGALLNANGEVIGINSVKVSDSSVEGMGYAIPISDVSDTITSLMNQETKEKVATAEQGYLGIAGVDVSSESAQMYNMPTGVYVSEAMSGGGAADAGITKGCVITAVDGTSIDSMSTLQGVLEYYKIGEKVKVTYQVPDSNGSYTEKTVSVKLTKKLG